MSRIADYTSLAGARVVSSDRIVAMRLSPPVVGFEPIAFGIADIGRVVVRPVVLAHARLAVVPPAGGKRRRMERRDARSVRGGEVEM